MPYVEVKLIGPLSSEQKSAIAKGITQVLKDVAGKSPESTYVVIQEVARENWAVGGVLFSDRSKV